MKDRRELLVKGCWAPLSPDFRWRIRRASEEAFAGRNMMTTNSGEPVLLEDVLLCNRKAEGPLAAAFRVLGFMGRSDVAGLIEDLYPGLLPLWIGCGTANPVHHTAYVLESLAVILAGEGENDESRVRVVMNAALFHDSALGLSMLPKITEVHFEERIGEIVRDEKATTKDKLHALKEYRDMAISARKEHMLGGAQIAEKRLEARVSSVEMKRIERIIEHHDDPKIPLLRRVMERVFDADAECQQWRDDLDEQQRTELNSLLEETGKRYLIGRKDWLLQYHHEADLTWMLRYDGIDADLARFSPANLKSPREIMNNNVRLHKQEVDLYRHLHDFCDYAFRNDTVYRSESGHMLFNHFVELLDATLPQ